jgi:hypothetical protein
MTALVLAGGLVLAPAPSAVGGSSGAVAASASARRSDDQAARLAAVLDRPRAEVRAALDTLAAKRRERLVRRLAGELDVDADDVRAALDEFGGYAPFGFAAALAGRVGLDPSEVSDALWAVRSRNGWHPQHGRLPLRQLATALDVSRAQLRKALRNLARPRPPAVAPAAGSAG